MKEQLEQIKAKALADLAAAADMSALDAVRVRVLGKKGELTAVLKQMGKLSAEERPVMGQMANAVRAKLEDALAAPASRDKARERERVFFKKLCIVRLRESIYCDYIILWLWRKGDAARGQNGLFADSPP